MAAAKPDAASGTGAPFCWPKVSNYAHQEQRPALGGDHPPLQTGVCRLDQWPL